MSEKTTVEQPHAVQQKDSIETLPSDLPQDILSPEDKFVLYAVLQDIAQELRRIKHDRQKHQKANTS